MGYQKHDCDAFIMVQRLRRTNDEGHLMPQDRSIYNDEIDLFELSKTLWDNKWLIIVFTLISLLVGIGFIYFKDPKYEAKLFYSPDNIPPFYSRDMVSNDFQKKFYSKNIFEIWKKGVGKTSLIYRDISDTQVNNGFVLSKEGNYQMVKMGIEKKEGRFFIKVDSNQLIFLDDLFKYANYVNKILQDNYVARAKKELEIIDLRFEKNNLSDINMIGAIVKIDRFVASLKNGENMIEIKHPTNPEKISPIIALVLPLAIMIGGAIGVTFVLLRNAVRQRKKQIAKA